ncbi:MAG: hypothetical protein RL139_125 [Gemmatimonadota bacterium]
MASDQVLFPGRGRFALRVILLCGVMCGVPGIAHGQGAERAIYRLPVPDAATHGGRRAQPGVTIASPVAFGPGTGDIFIGGGYQASTRYRGAPDGAVAVGGGIGDPARWAGVELVVISSSTLRSGFGDRAYGAAKIHRRIGARAAVAVGVEGVSLVGTAAVDPALFAAWSWVQPVSAGDYFSAITWNLGVGTARFLPESSAGGAPEGVGGFVSAAVRVSPSASAIVDFSGQDLNLGLSFAPFRALPLTLSPALYDVLGTAGSGMRFGLGVGLSRSGRRRGLDAAPGTATALPVVVATVNPQEPAAEPPAMRAPVPAASVPVPERAAAPTDVPSPPATAVQTRRRPAPGDADGDGVANGTDACMDTPPFGRVDARGCLSEVLPGRSIEMARFAFGQAMVFREAVPRLDELAQLLRANPDRRVEVGGHADETGSDAVNLSISQQRAAAVVAALVRRGVPEGQVVLRAYGRSRPIAPNDTPVNRAKNRRVELVLLP